VIDGSDLAVGQHTGQVTVENAAFRHIQSHFGFARR
jgi:hypothetical protein